MTYRRELLQTAVGATTVMLLTACGGAAPAPAPPTGKAAKPTARAQTAAPAVTQATAPAATTAPAAATSGDLDQLYAEAKREGHVTWWTAHYAQEAAKAVRDAFAARYPGIEVEYIRQTTRSTAG